METTGPTLTAKCEESWVDLFTFCLNKDDKLHGFVDTKVKFEELRWQYEVDTSSHFVAVKTSSTFGNTDLNKKQHKIQWEGENLLNHPYIVLNVERYECHHGPDRDKSKKIKAKDEKSDHSAYQKRRFHIQTTKKMNCPATIIAKEIIFFTDFEGSVSKYKREQLSKDIKKSMCDKDSKMEMKRQIFVSLPSLHQYHLQGEVAEISLSVDKRVVEKIEEYVSEGFLSSSLIRSLLEQFVKKEIFVGERCPSWTNRRFFPSQRDISNFIYTSKMKALKSKYDQENLEASLAEWARDRPQDCFEFSATDLYKDDTETDTTAGFFFLYQSSWQRRLLNLYGNEICFLDATYRTTKYSIPLFFLCVKTNIDYSVVAVFACQFENTRSIVRAISKIKEWNQEWNPKYFMVDHCEAEINTISTCFPGPDCQIFICDFHREQAWSRWLKATKHGLNKNMEDVLCMLRRIARAPTKVEFDDALSNLKEGSTWKNHKEFRNWFNNTWLKNVTMWAWLYRKDRLLVNINTNNGVERQNRTFKYDYLQKFIDRTLTGMLTTVITRFLPDQYKKYLDVNVKASQFYKQYNTNLPAFLHNRPKDFIDHCRKRILPAEEVLGKIEKKDDCLFTVESLTDQISTYDVFIGNDNDAPACKCEDWNRSHWPCKHLLAVVMHFPGSSWDDLPAHYRNNPMFVLDQKCILDIGFKVPSDSDDLPTSDPHTATPLVSFDDIKPVTTDSSVKIETAEDQNLSSKIREQLEEIKGFTYLEVHIDIKLLRS